MFRKVAVAVDGSAHAVAAVRLAAEVAKAHGAKLVTHAGNTQGRRSHVGAAPAGAQVHGDAQDVDWLVGDGHGHGHGDVDV